MPQSPEDLVTNFAPTEIPEHTKMRARTPESWPRVKELFEVASDLSSQEQNALLEKECAGDTGLRREVESLLNCDARDQDFIAHPIATLPPELMTDPTQDFIGRRLGAYRIIREIGRGGLGVVYLAKRADEQFQKEVAIKLIKRGLDTDSIQQRFRRERQILATLDHPNIGRLLDAGTTEDGLSFFVMEHIEGLPINDYCAEHKLTIRQRLELFQRVCAAIGYAHQRLVIHRDLKPSNILVTSEGAPKLLDFGIAKLLGGEGDRPAQTMAEQQVMTPEYASPEQLRGEIITTGSDVYSLGIVLYELLTGAKPYNLTSRKLSEVSRAITGQAPARPSLVSNQKLAVAERKILRGDLDNIILMALRKEPARRYSSVTQFSEDIRRYLNRLPVIARKDTYKYRTAKFITRHRVGVTAAVLVAIALVGGMAGISWQAHLARQEKIKAEEIKNFLERTLNYSNPGLLGKDVRETTVSEVLDEAAKQLENEKFSDQPEIKAELELVISRSYFGQGKYDLARTHLEKYLDLQGRLTGQNTAQALLASQARAALLFANGELTQCEKIYRQNLPLLRKEKEKRNIDAQTLAGALDQLAIVRRTQGDSKEAELLFRESLTLRPPLATPGTTRSTLASTLADQGKFEEALQTAQEAVAEYRERGETTTGFFAFAVTVLGGFLVEKGDYAEGDTLLRQAEDILRKFFLSSSLWLGDNLRNQALSFYQQERYAEALSKVLEALNIYREKFGTHYDHYPTALTIQGLILTKTDQLEQGEKLLRQAVTMRTESLPKEHYWIALARSALGECLTIQKRYSEAEPLLLESYESLKNSQGERNLRTVMARDRLAAFYQVWGRVDLADKYHTKKP